MMNNFHLDHFKCQFYYYKNKIDEKFEDELKLIKMKYDIEEYIKSNHIEGLDIYDNQYFSISLYNKDSLIKYEKNKSISRFCIDDTLIFKDYAYIIPPNETKFIEALPIPIDNIYLELRQGHNIIKTTSNLKKYMDLEDSSFMKPPLFTIVPLEYIKTNFSNGIYGYIDYLSQLNILLPNNGNYLVVDDMMIIVNPKKVIQNDYQVSNIIQDINKGFNKNAIVNIKNGEFYWLIHSTWTFYYWFTDN